MSYLFFYRGALTSKPYSFVARPWEFKSVESVDFFDSTGSSVRFDTRGDKILRILPRVNENVNEEWISDRIRFSVDGFRVQRIDRPFIKFDNFMRDLPWSRFMNLIFRSILLSYRLAFLKRLELLSISYSKNFFSFPFQVKHIGAFLDFETSVWLNFFQNTFFLRKLFFGFKSSFLSFRSNFLFPVRFKDFFKIRNLLIISINPRFEAPVFNIRLRQSVVRFGNNVSSFGQRFFPNFNLLVTGGLLSLTNFLNGKHWLCSYFTSQDSMILSNSAFANFINFPFFNSINNKQGFVGVFNRCSSDINASESGVFVDINKNKLPNFGFFRGGSKSISSPLTGIGLVSTSHGFDQLCNFDFVLPSSTPFEHNSTFINLEGRPQLSRIVLNSPNNVLDLKDSVVILFALFFSNCLNKQLLFRFSTFLVGGAWSKFLLSKNKKSLWVFVHKLLSSFNVSRSFFIKLFCSNVLDYVVLEKSLVVNDCLYNNIGGGGYIQQRSILNKNSSQFFESPDSFYIQDEISLSSPTLLAGDERMGLFCKTY
jgi:hypothetical protein